MANDHVVEMLEGLIDNCRDAEHAFLAAVAAVPDAAVKRLFTAYAAQRARFVSELEREIRRLDAVPRPRADGSGAPGRVPNDSLAALTRLDEDSVLAEVERGASIARRMYEAALKVPRLPDDVRSVIARQYDRVTHAHTALRTLQHTA